MINLIPPSGHKAVKHEYWIRVMSVWAFLLAALCIIFTLLLIPRYVLTDSQLEQFKGHDDHKSEIETRYDAAEKEILVANTTIEFLASQEPRRSSSLLLDALYEVQTPKIVYKNITFERKSGVVKIIKLQGQADTRSDLIAFRTALERSPLFTSASIPLSDLARDAELPFVVILTVVDGY